MQLYKTNQESIDKGILKQLFPNHSIITERNKLAEIYKDNQWMNKIAEVKIDNRIKGYCLKEVK